MNLRDLKEQSVANYLTRVSLILALPLVVAAGESKDQLDLKQATDGFSKTMIQCPNRVWPNYDWRTFQVAIVQRGSTEAVLWKGSDTSANTIPASSLPQGSLNTTFSFITLNGINTMVLSPDQYYNTTGAVFRIGVHELFHRYGQRGWTYPRSRGTTYPQSPIPRLYRRMLFDRLNQYLNSDGIDSTALGQAAFWYSKWKNEFPTEAVTSADAYEGTATFVEEVADAVRTLGCDAKETNLKEQAKALFVETRNGRSLSGSRFDLSFEGYDVGTIGALILRFIKNRSDWYSKMPSGQTPVSVLLDEVTPINDEAPAVLAKVFQDGAEAANKEIGQLVDSDLNAYRSTSFAKISIATTWLHSNCSPRYFVLSSEIPNATIMPMNFELKFQSGSSHVETSPDKVLFIDPQNPCEGQGLVAMVNLSEISEKDRTIEITGPSINGHLEVTKLSATNGIWYCTGSH